MAGEGSSGMNGAPVLVAGASGIKDGAWAADCARGASGMKLGASSGMNVGDSSVAGMYTPFVQNAPTFIPDPIYQDIYELKVIVIVGFLVVLAVLVGLAVMMVRMSRRATTDAVRGFQVLQSPPNRSAPVHSHLDETASSPPSHQPFGRL